MREERKEMKVSQEEPAEGISRRNLLRAGVLTAGALAAGGLFQAVPALSSPAIRLVVNGKEVTGPLPANLVKGVTMVPVRTVAEALGAKVKWEGPSNTVSISQPPMVGATEVPAWPWPYKKLDPEVVRKRGYENYFKGGCMYGTASALLITLVEEVGFPYNVIPIDMFKYGAGGSVSWGTLCGALNGAGAVINMVTKDYSKLIGELNGWYTEFPFPTNKHEAYCKIKNQITTVSKSPLCHVSVSTWVNANNPIQKVNEDGKKDRCAKLSGDVAAYTVQLLNDAVDQKFVANYKPAAVFSHCAGCHTGPKSLLDNQQGQMNCVLCHDDHTKK